MKVPTVVARSLTNYIKGGGTESPKARVMLNAMGWHEDGRRATEHEIKQARSIWNAAEGKQEEMPF